MSLSAAEKLEVIRLVEESELPVIGCDDIQGTQKARRKPLARKAGA